MKIKGYASTKHRDASGDVVESTAWVKGLGRFKGNPILLFNHDTYNPIGKVDSITVDNHGLLIEATVSEHSEKVYNLIQEDILRAFSVGFLPKDMVYDKATDTMFIKRAELLEVSVVSLPCNQHCLFKAEA